MRYIFIILVVLSGLVAAGQPYQRIPTPYEFFKVKVSQSLILPDTSLALSSADTGRIAIINGQLYISYLEVSVVRWKSITGGGSGTVFSVTAGDFLTGGTITGSGTIGLDTASAALKSYIAQYASTGDSSVLNFDLPSDYIIVDGDTVDVNIAQYIRDSVQFNLVIMTAGSTGDSLLYFQNDSVFQRRIRDSIFIKSELAADGARVSYIDTSLSSLKAYIGKISIDSARLTITNQLIPFGTNGFVRSSRELRYDSTANTLFLGTDSAGLTTVTHLNIQRRETWGTPSLFIRSINGGSTAASYFEINATSAQRIQISGTTRFTAGPQLYAPMVLETGGAIVANQDRPFILRMAPNYGGPRTLDIHGYGISVADSVNRPVFTFGPEGDLQIGRYNGSNINPWSALEVDPHTAKAFTLPQLSQLQLDSIGGLKYIYVTSPGTGYTVAPSVAITGGGGTGATAVARIDGNGRVIGIDLTSKGTGYTSVPSLNLTGGGGGSGALLIAKFGLPEPGMSAYNVTDSIPVFHDGRRWNDYAGTGWESYVDNQYTSGSPLAIAAGNSATITNNGSTKVNDQRPYAVDSLFNRTSQKFIADSVGDLYAVQVLFKAKNSSASGVARVYLEVGAAQVGKQLITFPLGSGVEHDFTLHFLVTASNAYMASGSVPKISAITGDVELYGSEFIVSRLNRAR